MCKSYFIFFLSFSVSSFPSLPFRFSPILPGSLRFSPVLPSSPQFFSGSLRFSPVRFRLFLLFWGVAAVLTHQLLTYPQR
nr:MAG TPA: hypothetical protein [Caudoviricetes sp.]